MIFFRKINTIITIMMEHNRWGVSLSNKKIIMIGWKLMIINKEVIEIA